MKLWGKTVAIAIAKTVDLSTVKSKATGSCRVSLGGATQQRQRQQHQQQKPISRKSITTSSHSNPLPLFLYLSIYLFII
jgi:hypothetical protein